MSKRRKRPKDNPTPRQPKPQPSPHADLAPGQSLAASWILRAFVVVAGAVIMTLEIVGSRILAPYFGTSIFVWGSLITVFLVSLSAGYVLGGRAADRWPTPKCLAAVGIAAGLMILAIPFAADRLCEAMVERRMGPRASPLLASALLFLAPSVVLAMTSPIAIRVQATTLTRLGSTAGTLYALSTVGSILGTVGTAFFMIPLMGVRQIVIVAGCLSLFAGLVVAPTRAGAVRPLIALAAVAAGGYGLALAGARPSDAGEIYRHESHYHNISVVESGGARRLFFNRFLESGVSLDPPHDTVCHYTDMLHLAFLFTPSPKRVLFVGGGGGIAPRRFRRDLPHAEIDVAEIDPAVIEVSRQHFFFKEDARLKAHAIDGRLFLRTVQRPYDIIVLDAYTINGQVPFHLMTREFLGLVKQRLSPGGTVIMNLITGLYGSEGRLYQAALATFDSEFLNVYVFPRDYRWNEDPTVPRNVMIVATPSGQRLTHEHITQTAHRLVADGTVTIPNFAQYAENLLSRHMTQPDDTPPLTDNHAPVEMLQMTRRW